MTTEQLSHCNGLIILLYNLGLVKNAKFKATMNGKVVLWRTWND